MSTTYLVDIEMRTSGGGLSSSLVSMKGKAKELDNQLSSLGGSLVNGFTGAVESVGGLLATGVAVAGAAAFGAVTYGVVGLNKELENTNIALGAIFNAQGFAKDFNDGMALAADTVGKMKQDVKSLPGDLGQLSSILKTIATPGAMAGASVDDLRKMAGQTMIVAGVMGLDTHMAEREMGMLLSGRAGAHNVLGTRLGFSGDSAKQLNHMAPEKRLQRIQAELAKYQPAMDAYGRSFTGLSTTLKDNVLYSLLGPATSPLFESVKHSMAEVNAWFAKNDLSVTTFAEALGSKLSAAWEWGSKEVKLWGPLVIDFVSVAYDRVTGMWTAIEPYAEKFAGWMKDALADPNGSLDKIKYVLELYGAVKAGGMAYDLLGGAAGMRGIGGGLATAGGAVSGLVGGAGNQLAALGLGYGSGPTVMAGLAVAAQATGVALLALGAVAATAYEGFQLFSEVSKDMDADAKAREIAGERVVKSMTDIDYTNKEYQTQMQALIDGTGYVIQMNGAYTISANTLQSSLLLAAGAAEEFARGHKADQEKERVVDDDYYSMRLAAGMTSMVSAAQAAAKAPKHPGGAGTHIAKVEIVVTSNQDPSRIARATVAEIAKLRRHPRSSADVTNYSATR